MRQTILIIIASILVILSPVVIVMNAPKCVQGHYVTKTRERCETKMKMVLTLGKGYQYAYVEDCNGYEEYQDFVCTQYESK